MTEVCVACLDIVEQFRICLADGALCCRRGQKVLDIVSFGSAGDCVATEERSFVDNGNTNGAQTRAC
jgi:hypothetical protein